MTKFRLSRKSKAKLKGVEPRLVEVVKEAIQTTEVDFAVICGVRTIEEQRKLVQSGASRTLNSKHLIQPDGFSHAVDLAPYVDGAINWGWEFFYPIAEAMRKAAFKNDVKLVWGGCWDTHLTNTSPMTSAKDLVEGYVNRRKSIGKSVFIDGPHFQLP